ncbi:MAG: histidine--tRNA ligase [Thaumarchaeota archaeon]|nr:histidine--tRNA ligase [Nitrososphaerota archaeon]
MKGILDLSLPRGIRDIEPVEYELHERIRSAFTEMARIYNFRLMEPGTIETLSLLRAKSGTAVDDEIYSFKDKGGREIGLRFDLTVGMTRYVVGRRDLKPPIKLASFGGVWRYDEPQHARYRWFHQWDVEVFGDPTIESDAEVMDLSYHLFQRLELGGASLQVGDRRVVGEFINKTLRIENPDVASEMMRALDKVSKKSTQELIMEYEVKGIKREDLVALIELGKLQGSPDKVLARLEELKLESAKDLALVRDSLRLRGVRDVEYNLSIVRGLDYYTAVVFEVTDKKRPDLGALCGGGRYDILPRIFGRPELAATGAAGGVERIALSVPQTRKETAKAVYVAFTEPHLRSKALEVLSMLRARGIRAEIGRHEGLRRQLEEASEGGYAWTVIVGKKELAGGEVVLRDMNARQEERLSPGAVAERVSQ